MTVSTVFLLLLIYTFGTAWATFLPRRSWVAGTRLEYLAPVLEFINPGEFNLKEVSTLHANPTFVFVSRNIVACGGLLGSLYCIRRKHRCHEFRCSKGKLIRIVPKNHI